MSCENAYFSGWSECSSLMKLMIGGALQKKGNTWTDATAQDASAWHLNIASATTANRNTLVLPINGFTNSTAAPTITKTAVGKNYVTEKSIPFGELDLDASVADYVNLHSLRDTKFEFVPFFQDGSYWLTRKSDGTLKGFRSRVETVGGLPPSDLTKGFPMHIFFDSYEEFENIVVVSPDFHFNDVLGFSPVGLQMRVTTPYTGGDVVVDVVKRGTQVGYTGLAAADFEVLFSNATPAVVVTTAVDNGLGSYTLTIQKDNGGTPANLTSADYAVVQPSADDTTYVTYLGNALKIVGGA